MDKNKIIEVNGRRYDAKTGLLIRHNSLKNDSGKSHSRAVSTMSQSVHAKPKRSNSLHRRLITKPSVATQSQTKGQVMDIATKTTAKFAPHPIKQASSTTKPVPVASLSDQQVKKHPLTATVQLAKTISNNISGGNPSSNLPTKSATKKPRFKTISLALIISFVMAIGLFLAYYFIPGISLKLAAFQAGIDASYPGYTPINYRLAGPVKSEKNDVVMTFNSNQDQSYTIVQSKSSWDSSALFENIVLTSGQPYTINQYSGITIYTYNSTASWVNAGKMYTLKSTSPLKSEDIRRIAISM